MSGGHTSDGSVAGADGNKGVDVVIDFVDYDAAHAGFRWGVAGQMELHEVLVTVTIQVEQIVLATLRRAMMV
jgi:hypothetical protein